MGDVYTYDGASAQVRMNGMLLSGLKSMNYDPGCATFNVNHPSSSLFESKTFSGTMTISVDKSAAKTLGEWFFDLRLMQLKHEVSIGIRCPWCGELLHKSQRVKVFASAYWTGRSCGSK